MSFEYSVWFGSKYRPFFEIPFHVESYKYNISVLNSNDEYNFLF